MKIIKYTTLVLLFMFVSCNESEIDFVLPGASIIQQSELPDVLVQEAGNDIIQDFTLQSARGLDKLEIFLDGELYETIEYVDILSTVYQFQYTIPLDTPNGTNSEFNFVLTDLSGEQVDTQISFSVNTTFFQGVETINGTEVVTLRGRLNSDFTLTSSQVYLIEGLFSVENNSELTIEAGTTVYFKTYEDNLEVSRLHITQGCKINAIGTANEPIIFTSDKILLNEEPSIADWGGILIYGNAPSNQGIVLDAGFRYGGNIPNDNSGTLRYIRSEYAGKNNTTNQNDAHAFKFFGVGSATQIDHLQVFRNRNAAFRIKGGRVNVKYLAGIGHGGYGLWGSEGWQGNGQFILFQTDIAATLDPNFWNIARSIEMRGDDNNPLLEPRTDFQLSNITCIGNGNGDTATFGTRRGLRFRTGARGVFQNAIITEFPNDGTRIEDLDPEELGDTMIFDNVRSFNNFLSNFENDAVFFAQDDTNYNVSDSPVPGISISNFVGSESSNFNPTALGSFFTSAPYIGAVESSTNDWTSEGEWFKNLDGTIR